MQADSIALALSTIAPGEKLGKTYAIEKYAETFQHFKVKFHNSISNSVG